MTGRKTCPNCGRPCISLTASLLCPHCIAHIDKEVLPLIIALSKVSGIRPVSSCCGHGIRPLTVRFRVYSEEGLDFIKRKATFGWNIQPCPILAYKNIYLLESMTVGEAAYQQAEFLVTVIEFQSK